MFRELLDKVRMKGLIEVDPSPFLKDMLPIVYSGEADRDNPNAVEYYNSGGRSVMFERGDATYRVKGVDPFALLTERVVASGKNRIKNVADSDLLAQEQKRNGDTVLKFGEKPFGPFFIEQAELEMKAFESLKRIYERLGIQNPCEFVSRSETGIEVDGRKTYQTAFRLPSLESDFRVYEFDSLLTERLDQCTTEEIAAKSKEINRLYGRFMYWAGVNAAILAITGLLPIANSFVPQNWVIGRHGDGYGIFRVDHTSTRRVGSRPALVELTRLRDGAPAIANEFSIFPSRVQIAANPGAFLTEERVKSKFSEILFRREGINVNEESILEAHKNVFSMGLQSTLAGRPPEPIPEYLFRAALS